MAKTPAPKADAPARAVNAPPVSSEKYNDVLSRDTMSGAGATRIPVRLSVQIAESGW